MIWPSRLNEIKRFNRPYMTSYKCISATVCISSIVSQIQADNGQRPQISMLCCIWRQHCGHPAGIQPHCNLYREWENKNEKTWKAGYQGGNFYMFGHFYTIPECETVTERQTNRIVVAYISYLPTCLVVMVEKHPILIILLLLWQTTCSVVCRQLTSNKHPAPTERIIVYM